MRNFNYLASKLMEEFEVAETRTGDMLNFFDHFKYVTFEVACKFLKEPHLRTTLPKGLGYLPQESHQSKSSEMEGKSC